MKTIAQIETETTSLLFLCGIGCILFPKVALYFFNFQTKWLALIVQIFTIAVGVLISLYAGYQLFYICTDAQYANIFLVGIGVFLMIFFKIKLKDTFSI